jgi:arginine deiminase
VIIMPFGVYSEVGRLRRVMVHRPGLEHSRHDGDRIALN